MRSPELQLLTKENIATHPRAQQLRSEITKRLDALLSQENVRDKEFFDVKNLYTEEIAAVEAWCLSYVHQTRKKLIGKLKLFVIVTNPLSASERRRYTKLPVLTDTPAKKPTLSPVPLQRIVKPNS